jgi:hypothetical protein
MRRYSVYAMLVLLVSVSAGYSKTESQPHRSAEPLKVVFSDPWLLSMMEGEFDTRVLVKCTDYRYTDKRREDRWFIYGCRTDFEVLKVERGAISASRLMHISPERRPTPESGIMLSMGPRFILRGGYYRFDIDMSGSVPKVVGTKKLSPVPPHRVAKDPFRGSKDPNTAELRSKVVRAAMLIGGPGVDYVLDATDDMYIVEHIQWTRVCYILVDKNTLAARWLEAPVTVKGPLFLYTDGGSLEDALKWLGVKPEWIKDESRVFPDRSIMPNQTQQVLAKRLLEVQQSQSASDLRQLVMPESAELLDAALSGKAGGQAGRIVSRLRNGALVTSYPESDKFIAMVESFGHKENPDALLLGFYHYDEREMHIVTDEIFEILPFGGSYRVTLGR